MRKVLFVNVMIVMLISLALGGSFAQVSAQDGGGSRHLQEGGQALKDWAIDQGFIGKPSNFEGNLSQEVSGGDLDDPLVGEGVDLSGATDSFQMAAFFAALFYGSDKAGAILGEGLWGPFGTAQASDASPVGEVGQNPGADPLRDPNVPGGGGIDAGNERDDNQQD